MIQQFHKNLVFQHTCSFYHKVIQKHWLDKRVINVRRKEEQLRTQAPWLLIIYSTLLATGVTQTHRGVMQFGSFVFSSWRGKARAKQRGGVKVRDCGGMSLPVCMSLPSADTQRTASAASTLIVNQSAFS